jgi:hypothetical protein
MKYPPLKLLPPDDSLSLAKLAQLELLTADALQISLLPGRLHCLKVSPEGTILDGNHRIYIFRKRKVDVDVLPREIQFRDPIPRSNSRRRFNRCGLSFIG